MSIAFWGPNVWEAAYLSLIAMNQYRMARCVPQNHLHLSNLVERVDGLLVLVCDDRDSKMRDSIRVDIVGAFQ